MLLSNLCVNEAEWISFSTFNPPLGDLGGFSSVLNTPPRNHFPVSLNNLNFLWTPKTLWQRPQEAGQETTATEDQLPPRPEMDRTACYWETSIWLCHPLLMYIWTTRQTNVLELQGHSVWPVIQESLSTVSPSVYLRGTVRQFWIHGLVGASAVEAPGNIWRLEVYQCVGEHVWWCSFVASIWSSCIGFSHAGPGTRLRTLSFAHTPATHGQWRGGG